MLGDCGPGPVYRHRLGDDATVEVTGPVGRKYTAEVIVATRGTSEWWGEHRYPVGSARHTNIDTAVTDALAEARAVRDRLTAALEGVGL